MLFDAKDIRILLTLRIYTTCNVRFKRFRFYVRHFDFWLNWNRIVNMAMFLSAAVTTAFLKTSAATLNLISKVIYVL